MERKRSLTHVGGGVSAVGDSKLSVALAYALDVTPAAPPTGGEGAEEEDRAHVHGFHTYPARMHPETAARLIGALASPNDTIFDPFCGSGTVLVEAAIARARAYGTDLNPLAIRLASLKCNYYGDPWLKALHAEAIKAAEVATYRREQKSGASHRYPDSDMQLFSPHVLLELDGLAVGIAHAEEEMRPALELVLSAILVKVSQKRSDTTRQVSQRRIAAGYTTKLFVKKAVELCERMKQFRSLVKSAPQIQVGIDNATRLETVPEDAVDLVVTSPPYAATYDYYAHHELRFRWLNLDARTLESRELGARRTYSRTESIRAARDLWFTELTATLRALEPTLREGAKVVLLMADSAIHGEALRADASVEAAARETGFNLVAAASQSRPHFHMPTMRAFEKAPRREHLLLLERDRGQSHHSLEDPPAV